MKSDRERWENKYSDRAVDTGIHPDEILAGFARQFTVDGPALDVAAGTCSNACFLAQLGFDTFAVDISHHGLALCLARAAANRLKVMAFVADLSRYPLPVGHFSAVCVTNFLDRSLFTGLKACVRPGGWLFYRTFNRGHLRDHPGFPQQYVLEDGELNRTFAGWQTIGTNEHDPGPETTSYWMGRKSTA